MHETGGLSIYRAWPMLENRTRLGLAEREDTQNWIKPKIFPPPVAWGRGGEGDWWGVLSAAGSSDAGDGTGDLYTLR